MASDLYVTFPGVAKNFMKPSIPSDSKQQFLTIFETNSSVSWPHELRNPLAPLRNGLEIIRRSQAEPKW